MLKPNDLIEVHHNLRLEVRERGKLVTQWSGHNVFTNTGRDWLARLSAWQTVGAPDVPFTNRRVRWMGLGTGTQAEVATVTSVVTPAAITTGTYLGEIQRAEFPTSNSVEFIKSFTESEISQGAAVVPITEAGLFVDVLRASTSDGVDDAAVGGGSPTDTTLNPNVLVNAPIAYKTFPVINKTIDFAILVRWTLTF